MTKKLGLLLLMVGFALSGTAMASMQGISESQWNSYGSDFWFSQTCDEVVENEVYDGYYGVYLDNFVNPSSNKVSFYIHNNKVFTRGNYLLYNTSKHPKGNGMTIFNRGLLESKGWKVNPGEKIRHMTTAEEVDGATFSFDWKMDNPFTAFDGKVFTVPNYRSNGTHPSTPTKFPFWDAEFRTITLYDTDDKLSTTADNRVIVECQRNVIRRCGDGILDTKYGETCDPKDPTKKNRGNGGCDPTTCQPITVIETPKCASKYNGQTVTNLVEGPYLCEVGTVSEFNYDENTHTWTWKCKNTAGNSVNCSAKKPYDGTLKIEKTLTTAKQIKEVGETVKWEIVVKAVSGDVKDFTITDTLPDVLDYVDYAIKYNPSNLTVMAPTRDGKKVTWQVTGTLKSGQTLKIELITKANKMPTQEEKNVACVKGTNPVDPNNPDYPNDDCDDDSIKGTKGKLIIEKTLTTAKQIKEVGEEVKWNIKVFAVSGDVTNFTVTDSLPDVLDYVSYKVVSNPANLTLSQPTVNGKNIAWKVTGTLKSGQVLELELVSKANTMPTKEEKNVACVKGENTDPVDPNNPDYPNDDCDDDSIEPKLTPKVWIKKTFDDGSKKKTVKVGEKMTYRITFGNSGNADATITSIKDFLPKNVQYISGSIYLNSNSSHEQFTGGETIDILRGVVSTVEVIDGVHVEKYGGITLKPGDTGYILIEVKVLERKENDSTTNFACIYVNDEKVDCDDAVHDITDSELLCKAPTITTKSFGSSGGSTDVVCKVDPEGDKAKTIELDCGTGAVISGTTTNILTGSNISSLTGTCVYPSNSSSSTKTYVVQCKVDGKTSTASGSACADKVTVSGHGGGGNDPYCTKPVMTGSDRIKEVTCKTDNGRAADIKIDCGYNNQIYTSTGKVESLTGKCDYTGAPSGTYTVLCYANDKNLSHCNDKVIFTGNICKSVTVSPASSTSAGPRTVKCETNYASGDVDSIELYCDYANNKTNPVKTGSKVSSLTGECSYSSNGTYQVQCVVNGKVEDSCKTTATKSSSGGGRSGGGGGGGGGKQPPVINTQKCFNVNEGQVSIEQGEILPFYLNIEKQDEDELKNSYKIVSGYAMGDLNSFERMKGKPCSDYDEGDIALNSMKCHYKIMDGNSYHNINIVNSGYFACLTGKNATRDNMINYWIAWQRKEYGQLQSYEPKNGTGDTFWSNVQTSNSSEWSNVKNYGEYKLQLDELEFLYCDGNVRTVANNVEKKEGVVCQSNFLLTTGYSVQKTPSGNLTTTSTKVLEKYTSANGDAYFKNMLNNIASTDSYVANDNVKKAMTSFENKYKKLAVSVSSSKWKNVKKVPGKNIYFVDGDITLTAGDIKSAFTIVQTNSNKTVTISGNVQHNMMVLSKGDIKFEGNCTSDQEVKGIFYAKNLTRSDIPKNTNVNNGYRCSGGGLHVKGILIGDGLTTLIKKSRSHLDGWFDKKTDSIRKSILMNGASVLIEYSPSIFTKSTMPPGAEDFTTALTVYKN